MMGKEGRIPKGVGANLQGDTGYWDRYRLPYSLTLTLDEFDVFSIVRVAIRGISAVIGPLSGGLNKPIPVSWCRSLENRPPPGL